MRGHAHWLELGYRHPLWELHRYYLSLGKGRSSGQDQFLESLKTCRSVNVNGSVFEVDANTVELLFRYLEERNAQFEYAYDCLRTEQEALDYCSGHGLAVGRTATRSADHHQSSKAMIAAVTHVARGVCTLRGVTFNPDPSKRCVWFSDNALHVSARNLDGAIPGLANPTIIWEIKEYWGQTSGGSKMSDAVYECHLVGLELREFEARGNPRVNHVVFVDGKAQWSARKSDLRRLIDLMNQGLVDYLFVGREVESEWESTLLTLT